MLSSSRFWPGLCTGFLLLSFIGNLNASHYSSGEVYYQYSPTPTDTARYEIFVTWYRNTSGADLSFNTQNVCLTSSCYPNITVTINKVFPPPGMASPNDSYGGWIVPGTSDCADDQDSAYKDLAAHKFSGFVSLPGQCHDFKFKVSAPCCRDVSDNMATSPNMFMEVYLNNTLGPSSSPQFTGDPGIGFCVQPIGVPPVNFSQKAIDPDGDSVIYRFAQPLTGNHCDSAGSIIPFAPGFTVNNPIPSNTGIQINQQNGVFSFSPNQQGSYVVKFEVESFRFDTVSLFWVPVGSAVRELQIPVTASCNSPSSQSFGLQLKNGTYTSSLYLNNAMDSIQSAYQLPSLARNSNGPTEIFELLPVGCFSTNLTLEFELPLQKSSISPTDFRLFAPDGSLVPIIAVHDSGAGLFVDSISLELLNPMVQSGNYLLQFRVGNDGNTLLSKCGYPVDEFVGLFVSIGSCPSPVFELEQVSVLEDEKITLQWSANSALQNSNVQKFFGGWDIFASENQGPWNLIHSLQSPAARSHTIDFNGSNYPVDHNNYEFFIDLRYAGENWGTSRTCESILLEANSSKDTGSNYDLDLTWNDYDCLDPNQRGYLIEYGHFFRVDSVIWLTSISTNLNQHVLSIPKSHGTGLYAIRVIAKDPQNQALPSQSNWVIFDTQNPISIEENAISWQIPNILNPNGNGQNESFYIQRTSASQQEPSFSLKVFNQTGQLVFSDAQYQLRNTPATAWKGGNLGTGIYFYEITFTGSANKAQAPIQGKLLLVK
ncbi:gliding motility-associated C-terminal domain-containing protein [Croceimicrobium sp.]|uniref:T9SS type B sorting domain-containing protein n=1 Tax=Croceimicrobium sp. TaxID=2828340 RepID=UPI003BAD2885